MEIEFYDMRKACWIVVDQEKKELIQNLQDDVTSDIDDTLTSETTQMHSSRLSPVIPLASMPPLRAVRRSISSDDDSTIDEPQQ